MKLVLLLIATGDCRCLNGNKLLHLLHGKMMYEYIMEELELVTHLFDERVIVTRYPEIMRDLDKKGYRIIENTQNSLGIADSLRLALDAVANQESACYFVVFDQPYLKGHIVAALIDQWRRSKKGIVCPSYHGNLCNPVLLSGSYLKEFLELTGDVGSRFVVKKHMEDVCMYEMEESGYLMNIV